MAEDHSTFPLLSLAETVQCLQELSIPVTDADLKDPQVDLEVDFVFN